MSKRRIKQLLALDRPPLECLPLWGRRLEFAGYLVELVPAGERAFNVRLEDTFASISFAPAQGTSSLAGDRLRRYERRAFEFIVVPPLFPLKGETQAAPEVLAFVIRFEELRPLIAGALGVGATRLNPELILGNPTPFTTALAKKVRIQLSAEDPSLEYVNALCIALIIEMLRPMVERRKSERPRLKAGAIEMLLKYIDANLDSDLRIEKLAELVGVSTDRISRAFKSEVGDAPHSYVIGRRTDAARSLLRDTDLDLAQIAFTTGFSSQSHMTTAFKKVLGKTPGAIRRES